ncbi:DUF6241 domain-containing protein [Bacillus sp. es.036]|uniref:DUF6241 domain-containing protein n=1 Tax=Bacillus sp. es.036 TaxID=1761764 RepID=UPI000BF5A4FC|nr:DUF6241 domain-containing protein [Bacillus sp. es.036]PFG15011.1 hypothetical protein ATG70_3256 [Bacillus sp. es.036]
MEDKLKNLRKDMNETVLKKGEVSEEEKERIYYKVIKNSETKKKTNRLVPVLSIVSCFILLVLFSAYGYSNYVMKSNISVKGSNEKKTGMSEVIDPEKSETLDGERLPLFPSEKEPTHNPESIPTELQFMNYIHGMTHQKVQAEEKWSLYEMNDKNISNLLNTLEKIKDQQTYEHYDFYYETLIQWKKGNFENAVDVHNKIWRWSGGSTGKATRLLTDEEEQEFISQYYK